MAVGAKAAYTPPNRRSAKRRTKSGTLLGKAPIMKLSCDIDRSGAGRRLPALVCLFFLASLVAGCLEVETTVRVEGDGSGTITERFVMGKDAVEMLSQMTPEGETFSLLDEDQLKEAAAEFGDGVRYESAESVENDFGQGYVAHYAFDDVNQLRLNPNPGEKVPGGEPAEPEETEPEFVTFTLEGSAPSTLVVRWPVDEGAFEEGGEQAEAEGEAVEPSAEELEMVKAFMDGMRMAMHVETAGEIIETNATHREGSRVTLLDFAFGELLSNPDALKAMMMEEPKSLAEAKELFASIPGLKFETETEVTIRFQ